MRSALTHYRVIHRLAPRLGRRQAHSAGCGLQQPSVIPAGVIEHDGMLWKPRRGATASAEEFIAARTLFIELNHDAMWNPWIRDEREADIDAAAEIMGQWQRAEPGHRHLSLKQWEAQQARRERKREQQRAKDEARRERDKARYDEQRCHRPTPADRGAVESRPRGRRVGRLPRRHQVPRDGCEASRRARSRTWRRRSSGFGRRSTA